MSRHGFPERLSDKCNNNNKLDVCDGNEGIGNRMEIIVESLCGSAFQMTVCGDDTIYSIKCKIYRVEGIPMSHQHLLYNLKELEDSCSLSDYNIKDGSTLKLVLSIRGGPISTRRLPLPAVEDLHWRDIKDFVENNRDEAADWLPPGCKMLVFKNGNNVNLLKVIEDDDDDNYTTLSDYSFSDETAVTMCKMIDLRSKMEKLSMKRNKKKHSSRSKLWMNRVENVPSPTIKRTTSEENISSTFKGVFDETPNFTKYKYGKMSSNRSNDDNNISNYCSVFQVVPHSSSSKNDKFGLWQPITSVLEIPDGDANINKSWQACSSRGFLSRESSTSDFFKTKSDCSSSTESFKDSILAGTFGNNSGKLDAQDVDAFTDNGTSDKGFLREDGDLLTNDVISQSNATHANPNIVGSGPGGVVLETTTVPTPALPLPLVAHSPNSGSNYGDYSRVKQLLSNSTSENNDNINVSTHPTQYDEHHPYYYTTTSNNNLQTTTSAAPSSHQIKRMIKKMMFGSNSHLNTAPEPIPGPSYALGSEPHLDQLDDLAEERIPPKSAALSSSISNLFLNSHGSTKLSLPSVDRTWSSELDKSDNIKYKRASTVRPGNMVFSSSTSDLIGLKRHKILPSLSRHPNCERLDVSDENLNNMETTLKPTTTTNNNNNLENIVKRSISNNSNNNNCTPSLVSWPNSSFPTKTYSSSFADDKTIIRPSHSFTDNNNKTIHKNAIRYLSNNNNGNSISDLGSNSTSVTSLPFQYGIPGTSRRNLEVGSERRSKRIKKILKLDHNNLHDNKSRLEVVSRKNFLLGYGGQGYEASIQKMPNNNCQIATSDVNNEQVYSRESTFSPLYERRLRVYSNRKSQSMNNYDKMDNSTSKLLSGLKHLNTSVENIEDKKIMNESVITTTQQSTDIQPDQDQDTTQMTKKAKRIRCAFCKKRLSIASIHTCRCGVIFCAPHRYAEVHGCQYDYKAEGQEYLRRANPLVSAPKLPKI